MSAPELISVSVSIVSLVVSVATFASSKRKGAQLEYNMISETYREIQDYRDDLFKTEKKLPGFEDYRRCGTSEQRESLALVYKSTFHDSEPGSEEFVLCRRTRKWLDQLEAWGQMLKGNSVRAQILFGVIGKAFEIDYPAIEIAVRGHRAAHPETHHLYLGIDILKRNYDTWIGKGN